MTVSVPSEGASFPDSVVLSVAHHSVEWAPGDTSELDVIEPFGGDVLQVLNVSDGGVSLGGFGSSDSSSQVDDLVSDLGVGVFSAGLVQQGIEQA